MKNIDNGINMKKFLAILLLMLIFFLLMGCSTFVAPEDTYRISPPAEWKQWWNDGQSCIQKSQHERFESIHWYIVPGDGYIQYEGAPNGAAAITVGQDIYIAERMLSSGELKRVVVHELVHAIDHINDHPYDPFWKCNLMHEQIYTTTII